MIFERDCVPVVVLSTNVTASPQSIYTENTMDYFYKSLFIDI